MKTIDQPLEFDWDKGNIEKSLRHQILDQETEEVFFDEQKKTFKDKLHSGKEERFRVVGKTKEGKLLFVVFTVRKGKIRIISARIINKKEVYLYEEVT